MLDIVIMGFSLFELSYLFFFWSIVGWLLEVTFTTLETGEFESRGMLGGPYCPIYGFGVIFVVVASRPIYGRALLLFFVSAAICTLLELFVGVMLEKLFGAQWWNYATYKYNYKGYIALKISLLWGAGCLIVVRIAHPAVMRAISLIPVLPGTVILAVLYALLLADTYQTVSSLLKFKRKLYQLEKLHAKLFETTNAVGANLSGEVNDIKCKCGKMLETTKEKSAAIVESTKEKLSGTKEKTMKRNEDFSELFQKYENLLESTRQKSERFLKAFPDVTSRTSKNALNAVKERFNKVKNKKNNDNGGL